MKFRIRRASDEDNRKPYDKAVLEEIPYIEARPEKRVSEIWYKEGYNHYSDVNAAGNDILYRTVNNLCWTIEVNHISELFEIYHSIVVEKPPKNGFQLPVITIYDDYLE